jgi:hypothetical protein
MDDMILSAAGIGRLSGKLAANSFGAIKKVAYGART